MESAVQLQPDSPPKPDRPWSLAHRIAFRFVCCYFLLYMAPDPPGRVDLISVFPGGEWLANLYGSLWHKIVPWVAIHVFHLSGKPTTYFLTGSGDTTLDYIENLLFLVFAAAATAVWSLADRQRPNYRRLHEWLRLAVRYTLAFTLFSYGFAKVFPLQFSPPGFQKLTEPYGDFSPMGVLWSFMGASLPYTIFAGLSEVTGGALLLFRRATTIGALVSFGVLLNVAMLNFCYDVPVKLYSTNLALMAIFLAAPEIPPLLRFLLRPGALPSSRRWMRFAAIAFQCLFVGYFLCSGIGESWKGYQDTYIHPKRPPLYGLYDVETFTRNGQELPPLTTDATRWKKVAIQSSGYLGVRMMDDKPKGFQVDYDEKKSTVALGAPGSKDPKSVFAYSRPDPDHVLLQGALAGDTFSVRLRKIDTSRFLLTNRGFHWINELPFNR